MLVVMTIFLELLILNVEISCFLDRGVVTFCICLGLSVFLRDMVEVS